MEKYLGGNIVRIIAYHAKLPAPGQFRQIKPQEVGFDNTAMQLREISLQILHTLPVKLHHRQIMTSVKQKTRQHSHAGSDLDHRHAHIVRQCGGNPPGHREVGQKMLPERFFRFNFINRHFTRVSRTRCIFSYVVMRVGTNGRRNSFSIKPMA